MFRRVQEEQAKLTWQARSSSCWLCGYEHKTGNLIVTSSMVGKHVAIWSGAKRVMVSIDCNLEHQDSHDSAAFLFLLLNSNWGSHLDFLAA